jgi:hypothetical protein
MLQKVKEELRSERVLALDQKLLDDSDSIEKRVSNVDASVSGSLRTALRYIYLSDGPTNLQSQTYNLARPHLSRAEDLVSRYFRSRTNANNRATYGKEALNAARKARYCCVSCSNPDLRLLVSDHVYGRHDKAHFFFLCANCHQLKSRIFDWSGKPRSAMKQAKI